MWSERDEKHTRAGEQRLGCSLCTQTLRLCSWVLALGVVLLLPRSSGSEGRGPAHPDGLRLWAVLRLHSGWWWSGRLSLRAKST